MRKLILTAMILIGFAAIGVVNAANDDHSVWVGEGKYHEEVVCDVIDPFEVVPPAKKPIIWRYWLGATYNRYGWGPKMDLEGRKGRWGIKVGISLPKGLDYKCVGALQCAEISRAYGQSSTPVPRPTPGPINPPTFHTPPPTPYKPPVRVIVEDTQTTSQVDLMLSWTK